VDRVDQVNAEHAGLRRLIGENLFAEFGLSGLQRGIQGDVASDNMSRC